MTVALLSKYSIFRVIFGLLNEIYIFFRAIWIFLSGKKAETKRDHYVPQMILRNFAIDSETKKGLIYEYERGKSKPTDKSISKKIACKPGFYLTKNKFTKRMDNTKAVKNSKGFKYVLNRHAVLHGESNSYGTQKNSLQGFMLLDVLSLLK